MLAKQNTSVNYNLKVEFQAIFYGFVQITQYDL